MKYTLVELTQAVSSSIDGDEINSIQDTVESLQIVDIIKSVLDDMISRGDLNILKTPFNLVASGDNTKPTLMYKPDVIDTIDWIKYNCYSVTDTDPAWRDIYFLPPEEFIQLTMQYSDTDTAIGTYTYANAGFAITIPYTNNAPPRYYTSFDGNSIIFDGYDAEVDTTLQSSKTTCFGKRKLDWQQLDNYVPPLDSQQFPLLLAEAKSVAWAQLRQTPNQKIEQTARRGWTHLQKSRQSIPSGKELYRGHNFSNTPDYGRR
jgi:hypothetical protein